MNQAFLRLCSTGYVYYVALSRNPPLRSRITLQKRGMFKLSERFTKGLETMRQYVSEEELQRMVTADALADIAPDLRKFIVEYAYGDIYSRDGLSAKQRALVVISSVVTQGAAPQTKTHIRRGLHAGLTEQEIVEALLQLAPYIGFPRVQNALVIAQEIFQEASR